MWLSFKKDDFNKQLYFLVLRKEKNVKNSISKLLLNFKHFFNKTFLDNTISWTAFRQNLLIEISLCAKNK